MSGVDYPTEKEYGEGAYLRKLWRHKRNNDDELEMTIKENKRVKDGPNASFSCRQWANSEY